MRVADCKNLSESPEGVFRQSKPLPTGSGFCILYTPKSLAAAFSISRMGRL